jgi:hypothetical protein
LGNPENNTISVSSLEELFGLNGGDNDDDDEGAEDWDEVLGKCRSLYRECLLAMAAVPEVRLPTFFFFFFFFLSFLLSLSLSLSLPFRLILISFGRILIVFSCY